MCDKPPSPLGVRISGVGGGGRPSTFLEGSIAPLFNISLGLIQNFLLAAIHVNALDHNWYG